MEAGDSEEWRSPLILVACGVFMLTCLFARLTHIGFTRWIPAYAQFSFQRKMQWCVKAAEGIAIPVVGLFWLALVWTDPQCTSIISSSTTTVTTTTVTTKTTSVSPTHGLPAVAGDTSTTTMSSVSLLPVTEEILACVTAGLLFFSISSRITLAPAYYWQLSRISVLVANAVIVTIVLRFHLLSLCLCILMMQEVAELPVLVCWYLQQCQATLNKWFFRCVVSAMWLWGLWRGTLDLLALWYLVGARKEAWETLGVVLLAVLCSRLALQVYYNAMVLIRLTYTTKRELKRMKEERNLY